jgi:hypothetical protein
MGHVERGRDRPTGCRPSDQPYDDLNLAQAGWGDHHDADHDAGDEDNYAEDDTDQPANHHSANDDTDDLASAHDHHDSTDHHHHFAGWRRHRLLSRRLGSVHYLTAVDYQTPGSSLHRTRSRYSA